MFKELLLQFFKEKDQILFEKTNIHLYEEKDFLEIETWSEDFCKEFFNKLVKRVYNVETQSINFAALEDKDLCPWCLKKRINDICLYGERHGSCYKGCVNRRIRNNPYYKIIGGLKKLQRCTYIPLLVRDLCSIPEIRFFINHIIIKEGLYKEFIDKNTPFTERFR